MSDDISRILRDWPVKDGNVRKLVGDDGRDKIQVRVLINNFHGILQFDCDGRPDGETPHGHPFALDFYEEERRKHAGPFTLTHEQAQELLAESSMTYQRYVLLLQMGDFRRVIRDTERNMRVFRFLNQHAEKEEDRTALEKWWPYILRVHATAQALERLQQKDFAGARQAVQEARAKIEQLDRLDDETFQSEFDRSMEALNELEKSIDKDRPLSQIERLERLRDEAVAEENYELAARLRDRIRALRDQSKA